MSTILGRDLPAPRAGCQWSMQIYPKGYRVIVQAKPHKLSTQDAALAKLKGGHRVYVSLGDAIPVLSQAQLPSIRER